MEKNITYKLKKYWYTILMLSILTVLLFVTFLALSFNLHKNNKMEFSEYITILTSGIDESSDNDESIHEYGIKIQFNVDYKKHPKYNEWMDTYNLIEYYNEEEKVTKNFYDVINSAFYETIKKDFINIDYDTYKNSFYFNYYMINPKNETISDSRKRMSNIKKDFFKSKQYKKIVELSYENYINDVRILLTLPSKNNDWRL